MLLCGIKIMQLFSNLLFIKLDWDSTRETAGASSLLSPLLSFILQQFKWTVAVVVLSFFYSLYSCTTLHILVYDIWPPPRNLRIWILDKNSENLWVHRSVGSKGHDSEKKFFHISKIAKSLDEKVKSATFFMVTSVLIQSEPTFLSVTRFY